MLRLAQPERIFTRLRELPFRLQVHFEPLIGSIVENGEYRAAIVQQEAGHLELSRNLPSYPRP